MKKWHKGRPPSVGWWPASVWGQNPNLLRWWDGKCWSLPCVPSMRMELVRATAKQRQPNSDEVLWRKRPKWWPKRATQEVGVVTIDGVLPRRQE